MTRYYYKTRIYKMKTAFILFFVLAILMITPIKSVKADTKTEEYNGTLGSVINSDGSNLVFYRTSGYSWTGGLESGSKVALINGLYEGNEASFATIVEGPIKITFDWQKLHNVGSDSSLTLYVDNIMDTELAEKNKWVTQTVEVPSGYHTIEWKYKLIKLENEYRNYNSGFVDNVKVEKPAFKITFDENILLNAKTTSADVYKSSKAIKLPLSPIRFGYMFLGWNTKPDGSGIPLTSTTLVTSTQTVYAQWVTLESLIPITSTVELTIRQNKTDSIVLSNVESSTITYASANEQIATVNSFGEVTGINVGNTSITATITSKYGTIMNVVTKVTVKPIMEINKPSTTLNVNKTVSLKILESNNQVIWKSDDTKIATVSNTGVVKAIAEGNAIITGLTEEESFTCEITVLNNTDNEEIDEDSTPTNSTSLTQNEKVENSYNKFLSSSAGKKYNAKFISMFDLDNNQTPELIISDLEPFSGGYKISWKVFAYISGKVKFIGQIKADGLSYSKTKKTILACTGLNENGMTEVVYQFKKGKLTLIHTFYDGTSGIKKLDGKKTTKSNFEKKYNKYVDKETVEIEFYEINNN